MPDTSSPPTRFWNGSRIVVWLFMMLAMAANFAGPYLDDWLDNAWEISIPMMIGIVCGELCVVVLVSGLTGNTWLTGYFRGLVMILFWYLAFLAAVWIDDFGNLEPLS
jgi:hypothetical protein